MQWDFIIQLRLPDGGGDPTLWLDALFEAGCDDAMVGVGQTGRLALDFSREAGTATEAVDTAIADALRAVPGATITEVAPDLVNLADMADRLGCSRQNMRKYATGEIRPRHRPFPAPAHSGSPSLWPLAEVLAWVEDNTSMRLAPGARPLAEATAAANLRARQDRFKALERRAKAAE